MKKYILPLTISLLFNALVIIAILFNRPHHNNISQADQIKQAVKVNLNQVVTHLNRAHLSSHQATYTWITQHYGKAITVVKNFTAGKNLHGYVIALKSNPKQRGIIYSINNGEYFMMGTIIDHTGKNVTQTNALHYISNPDTKMIYNAAQKLPSITQGKPSAPTITIIIDPNSNLFPEQWEQVALDAAQGTFKVDRVLVNYLKPMGPNVAANIIQAKHPISALSYNSKNYNKYNQTGGYTKSEKITAQTMKNLKDNWSFVQKYNLYKMPVTIFKHKQHYYVLQGIVSSEALEGILFK